MSNLLFVIGSVIGISILIAVSYIYVKLVEWYYEGKRPWEHWQL